MGNIIDLQGEGCYNKGVFEEAKAMKKMNEERVRFLLRMDKVEEDYLLDYKIQLELFRQASIMSYDEFSYVLDMLAENVDDSFNKILVEEREAKRKSIVNFFSFYERGIGKVYLDSLDDFEKAELLFNIGCLANENLLDADDVKVLQMIFGNCPSQESVILGIMAEVMDEVRNRAYDEKFEKRCVEEIARRRGFADSEVMIEADHDKAILRLYGYSKTDILDSARRSGFNSYDDMARSVYFGSNVVKSESQKLWCEVPEVGDEEIQKYFSFPSSTKMMAWDRKLEISPTGGLKLKELRKS